MAASAPPNGLLRQAAERVQALEGLEEVLFSRLLAAKRPVVIAVLAALFLVLLGVQLWFIVTGFDDALDILLWFTLTAILALSFSLAMAWRWSGALYRRLENLEGSLKQRARYDGLTGLPNRAYFMKRLSTALGLAHERGDGLALLLIDLDNFLIVNGALGHEAGDALLKAVGERFAELAPDANALGRLGGDEYAILLAPAGAAEAEVLAQQVIQALVRPVVVLDQPIYLGASV
ncbi:MAG: GGDEF domain-containing protein, partial [Thiobacillaceae bacterium]|nr:GGDEF domain-containing protein [Thiobacillaceae bacterium]